MNVPFGRSQGSPSPAPQQSYIDLTVEETKRRLAEGDYDLVDVREPWEYQLGHLPGARLVPLNTLLIQARQQLTRDNVIFVCAHGNRSRVASEMAVAVGLKNVYNMAGGTSEWVNKGYPVEK
ncbi:MAG TPA: rhodanese-like domain-containing protein [Chloroflexota bacterium]|nr:rhodanese-like domain-containing protein [Chloroflexota bacterium]